MSGAQEPVPPAPAKEDPESLVLRGPPRPAVRFRRGLIVGLSGGMATLLVGLSWMALEPPTFRHVADPQAADEPARAGLDDTLADVPGTYAQVPSLGPPLPGDLGRSILEQQRGFDEPGPAGSDSAGAAEVERQRREAERQRLEAAREAARASPLLVQIRSRDEAGPRTGDRPLPEPEPESGQKVVPAPIAAAVQRRLDFGRSSEGDLNPHELRPSPSPWTLSAGTIIPASLITGLNSDLPGTVLAQVSDHVRDSATGRTVLIPQGARMIGHYDSQVAYGQSRAFLVWTRIVFPDGSSVRIENVPAADAAGHSGVEDRVDFHGWRLLKGMGLSTLLGIGTQLGLGSSESELVRALRESAQRNAADAGGEITRRNLDIQPTIRVRPGWPVRAILHKDLVLQPWRE